MKTVIGPVLARTGGFSFDIWQTTSGLKPSFTYRRVEDAHYARNYELAALCAQACDTVASFMAELA